MDAERSPDRIAECTIFDTVLSWEYFDTLLQAAPFHGDAKPEREVIVIDTALRRQQGFLAEDPKMTTTARLFESGIHTVLLEFPLQLKQRFERAVVVGVDRHPLRTLGLRVDGVEIDGQIAVEVHPHDTRIQRPGLFDIRNAAIGQGSMPL